MDKKREEIRDFFNKKWLKEEKSIFNLSLSRKLYNVLCEYERIYNVRLSRSQLVEMLLSEESDKIKYLPNYSGQYIPSDISRLKTEYKLVKRFY